MLMILFDNISIISIILSVLIGGGLLLLLNILQNTGKCQKLPGSYGIYYLGEALEYFTNPIEFTKNRFLKHGNIFKSKLFGHEVIFVRGKSAIRLFATGPENGLGAAPEAYLFDNIIYSFNPSKRRSILMSENDHQHSFKYITIKTTATLLFTQPGFLGIRVRDAITKWFISASIPSNTKISGVKLVRDIFLNITVAILFREVVNKEKLDQLLINWFQMNTSWPFSFFGLITTNWSKGQNSMKELEKFLSNEIKSRLSSDKGYGEDLIGTFLHATEIKSDSVNPTKSFSDANEKTILSDCFTVIDSFCNNIACACLWFLVCLEQAPGIKQVLITEIRNYQGEFDVPALQSVDVLPYLNATIEETLRIYGFLQTNTLKRVSLFDIDFEGHTIPKGMPIYLPLSSLNFSEDFFLGSTTFDPLRFMVGGTNYDTGGSYSFGIGHHACPGASLARGVMKVFAFSLLEGFDFTAVPNQSYEPFFQRGTKSIKNDKDTYFPIPVDGLIYQSFTPRPTRLETVLRSR